MIRKSLILQTNRGELPDLPIKGSVIYFSYFDSPNEIHYIDSEGKINDVTSKIKTIERVVEKPTVENSVIKKCQKDYLVKKTNNFKVNNFASKKRIFNLEKLKEKEKNEFEKQKANLNRIEMRALYKEIGIMLQENAMLKVKLEQIEQKLLKKGIFYKIYNYIF